MTRENQRMKTVPKASKKLPNLLKAVTVVTTAIVVYTVSPGEVRGDAEPCLYRNRKKISHYLVR